MVEFVNSVPLFVIYGLLGLGGVIIFLLGWGVRSVFATWAQKRSFNVLRTEQDALQRNMKKLWEHELHGVRNEKTALEEKLLLMEKRLENYRNKVAGLGALNFLGSKKRADILYSLLLENEALEAILNAQTQQLAETHQKHLKQRLMDIGKRQRLMAEIFNDQKIKDYVREVIDEKEETLLGEGKTAADPRLAKKGSQQQDGQAG